MHFQPRCENFYLNRLFLAVSNRIIFRRTRLDVYYLRRIPSLRHMLQFRSKFQESVLAMHEVVVEKRAPPYILCFFTVASSSSMEAVALLPRTRANVIRIGGIFEKRFNGPSCKKFRPSIRYSRSKVVSNTESSGKPKN